MKKSFYLFLAIVLSTLMMSSATSRHSALEAPVFLKVKVLDDLGNKIHGAKVQLFNNEEDYRRERNVVKTEYTEKNGKASFSGLKPKVYYMLVEKEGLNNNGGAVRTDTLKTWIINNATVIIQ